ncbi:hypothetical protein WR25_24072 [Diploscapter pachys]|uniref:F-box domain-containing protein n=1 Tax=Diploscapter pachys TaxID=2018661 RepID=A0A2A2J388_9BILA|nr:hypothetical protein WR25_24072 [Diploscapter pachys]
MEEILQYVGIHDLISTIKVNRRLYSIAHSAKSPLRHRLVKKAFDLRLQIWVTPGIANELCEFFFNLECIDLVVYHASDVANNVDWQWIEDNEKFCRIKLWRKCECGTNCDQYSKSEEHDFKNLAKLMKKINQTDGQGIREANFSYVQTLTHSSDKMLYHEILNTAEVVQIHGERLSANEEDILRLFNKATFLELRILSQMDTDGVIKIIQNFYENRQGRRRHIFIDIERRLDYSYIFARTPGIIDGQQSIPNSCVMKNKFDEMWEISVKQHNFEIKSHNPKSLQNTSNQ